MPIDFQLDIFERERRVRAIFRQHVKAHLRVEDRFRKGLEGEQRYGLLLQFINPGLAALADGLENFDDGSADGAALEHVRKKKSDSDGGGMRDGLHGTFRIEARGLDERRAQA